MNLFKLDEKGKKIVKGLIVFTLYFVLSSATAVPLQLLHIDYTNMSLTSKQIYLICYNLFIVLLFLFIYKEDIKKDFIDFKKNYKKYFKENIKYWLFALAIMYASNLIIAAIKYYTVGNISTAENEQLIRETLAKAPVYTFISAAIFAPIMEELTFRKSLRNIFSNKVLFIIISSFIFGGLHVFTNNVTLINATIIGSNLGALLSPIVYVP